MKVEYEAKFFIDVDSFKTQLNTLGAIKITDKKLMRRITFNLGDNKWARVRDEGNQITTTIKNMLNTNTIDGIKEVELIIDSFDKGCDFLQALGLQKKSYQENYREQWIFLSCELSIDQWPGLPAFVEIESHNTQTINNAIMALNLDPEKAMFGSIDILYERILNIPRKVFNNYPQITFESIESLLSVNNF